jgi:uncharacterized protein (DUF1501 family)
MSHTSPSSQSSESIDHSCTGADASCSDQSSEFELPMATDGSDQRTDFGCEEYVKLSRRGFIGASTAALAAAAAAPAWLPRVSFARDFNTPPQDVLVCVFLRGGADWMNMLVPFNDPGYVAGRPTTRLLAPDDTTGPLAHRAVELPGATLGTVSFGINPAMQPLLQAYLDGKLLIAGCTGLTGANKSHFDAQRYMERGKWQDPAVVNGWIGRNLASNAPINPSTLLRGVAVASGIQQSLVGGPQVLPVPDFSSNPGTPDATGLVPMNNLRNYGLAGSSTTRNNRRQVLHRIASDAPSVPAGVFENIADQSIRDAARNTVNVISRLNTIGSASYRPAGGAVYPANSFGYSLMTSAALIVANDLSTGGQAVDAIAVDLGGWDTHTNQQRRDANGTLQGSMISPMTQLAQGLAAFYADVIASRQRNVTLVVMSEFGRRVGENGGSSGSAPGTDHGYGSAFWVMGKNVLGGRVISKVSATSTGFGWPGVPLGTTSQPAYDRDMPIAIDYRHLLAEIVDRRLSNAAGLPTIFPGFTPQYQGIVS